MSNPRYLSIENIRFLAFVNKKIEDSIFDSFFVIGRFFPNILLVDFSDISRSDFSCSDFSLAVISSSEFSRSVT